MKKGVLLIIFVLLCSLSLVSASTSSVSIPTDFNSNVNVHLEIIRYSPAPVEPGQYFDLWVSLEMEGVSSTDSVINLDDIREVELELVEEYPFSIDPDDDPVRELGSVNLGEEYILKYRVRVDDTAAFGDNELYFIFRSEVDEGVKSPALDIAVQVQDPTLNVVSIETEPEQLIPGRPATLSISVENGGTSSFSNVNAVLDVDGSTVPIVPYKSSKEQKMSNLPAGETYTFTYDIIAEEDATAGVYKIPFQMTYYDANNTMFTKNDTFGLLIGSEADLSFNLEEFDTFQKGSKGSFVVSVSNVGPTDLKFMTITLLESDDYVILGPNAEYLGNVDSDDFETSSYEIYVNNKDDVALQFALEYKDAYNEEKSESFSVMLPVYSSYEVSKYGLNGNGGSIVTFFIYILIIAFIYYSFIKWRKVKNIEKALKFGLVETIKFPFRVLLFFRLKNMKRWPRQIKAFFSDL